jgi:RNA polymerase sigma-70 factor (ECF subfamily)
MTVSHAVHRDLELIAQIRGGDERAFEQLFRQYHRELRIYAARIDPTGGSAEEVVQEVFFRIWQHRERLMEVQSLGGYLYAATRNAAVTRRNRVRLAERWSYARSLEAPDWSTSVSSADEEVRAAEMAAAIDRAVAALPPRCRETFLLRRQQGMSYAEIARTMQTTPKTVEAQIGKALKLLRQALADWL